MSEVPLDLYRSCKSSEWGKTESKRKENFAQTFGKGSLYPLYEGFFRKDKSFRAPDVTTYQDGGGTWWVRGVEDRDAHGKPFVSWKEGVSVSPSSGGFGFIGWFYFLLPQGTPIPDSLDVRKTPTSNDPEHHSIRCRNLMRVDAYEGALDNLARAALAKAVELGRQSLHFS